MASKTFKVRTLPQCCFVGQGTPFPPWENSFLSHRWSDGCWEPWASRCWHLKTRYPPVLSPEVHRKTIPSCGRGGLCPARGPPWDTDPIRITELQMAKIPVPALQGCSTEGTRALSQPGHLGRALGQNVESSASPALKICLHLFT